MANENTGFILQAEINQAPNAYQVDAFREYARDFPIFLVELTVTAVNLDMHAMSVVAAPTRQEAGEIAADHFTANIFVGDYKVDVFYVNPAL